MHLCVCVCVKIFMKYGRQRWKLRGRLEANGRQVWDSEDMVFLPLVCDFLSIKVSELWSQVRFISVRQSPGDLSSDNFDPVANPGFRNLQSPVHQSAAS